MRVVKFNTPNGEYELPLELIAKDRANYYAKKDGVEIGSKDYQDEVDWVMKDDFEGIDWLLNSMDFEDWKDVALKVSDKVKVTDDDFWTSSGGFKIIER